MRLGETVDLTSSSLIFFFLALNAIGIVNLSEFIYSFADILKRTSEREPTYYCVIKKYGLRHFYTEARRGMILPVHQLLH